MSDPQNRHPNVVTKVCEYCGRPLVVAGAGRPRRYCTAACRQRAYRGRAIAAEVRARIELGQLALQLRDNADRLLLLSQGWHPPDGTDNVDDLLTTTVRLATELQRHGYLLGSDETSHETPLPRSPD
ncbi:hypothetical protein JOD54_002234 [Actinokineospora baliensis]|uniref:hypothetical protein n=1 Tax=Actinokineospora baliensis TaxID=547056 RepID=UPI00195D7174|nr:hypothetical protein [Actinokineospora baliensis]MBM7772030.1 hypothetical protein [Actinokineospora baliensis]